MLLVDARGSSQTRFDNIDEAMMALIYHDETALFINRTVGNGVTTYVENKLKLISEDSRDAFRVTRIGLGFALVTVQGIVDIARARGGIIVIDEAEYLDRLPGLYDALSALESPYIKFVYVAQSNDTALIRERFTVKDL